MCVADDYRWFRNTKVEFCEQWKQIAERFKLVTP